MLYAQIPPHLLVKTKEGLRNDRVEHAKEPLPVDDRVVRHANKQIDALLELEAHYRRQSAQMPCFNPRCMLTTLDVSEARFYSSRAVSSRWADNITDVRIS
jgi:hypothetical protein